MKIAEIAEALSSLQGEAAEARTSLQLKQFLHCKVGEAGSLSYPPGHYHIPLSLPLGAGGDVVVATISRCSAVFFFARCLFIMGMVSMAKNFTETSISVADACAAYCFPCLEKESIQEQAGEVELIRCHLIAGHVILMQATMDVHFGRHEHNQY